MDMKYLLLHLRTKIENYTEYTAPPGELIATRPTNWPSSENNSLSLRQMYIPHQPYIIPTESVMTFENGTNARLSIPYNSIEQLASSIKIAITKPIDMEYMTPVSLIQKPVILNEGILQESSTLEDVVKFDKETHMIALSTALGRKVRLSPNMLALFDLKNDDFIETGRWYKVHSICTHFIVVIADDLCGDSQSYAFNDACGESVIYTGPINETNFNEQYVKMTRQTGDNIRIKITNTLFQPLKFYSDVILMFNIRRDYI